MTTYRRLRRQAGISLIEALVALAVMAIGMLGLVGVQSTLRSNSDLAKQNAEAVRIAQQDIEQWRSYVALARPAAPAVSGPEVYYDDMPTAPATQTITGLNATYTLTRAFIDMPAALQGRQVKVSVSWVDRKGNTQEVHLDTLLTAAAPLLSGTLGTSPGRSRYQSPQGRNLAIPQGAKTFPDGRTSGFVPPGSSGVAWSFDNITGVVTICTITNPAVTTTNALTLNDIDCTANIKAILVSGFVRFVNAFPLQQQPTADVLRAANDPVTPGVTVRFNQTLPVVDPARSCYVNTGPLPDHYIEYYCVALTSQVANQPATPISGNVWLDGASIITDTAEFAASLQRVCRFFNPRSYTTTELAQSNQNLVVIPAGDGVLPFHCTIVPPAPATQLTWPHQPAADPGP